LWQKGKKQNKYIFKEGKKLEKKQKQKNTSTIRIFFKTLKHETKKGNTVPKKFKNKKKDDKKTKQKIEQKKEKKTIFEKQNEVCLLFPNFKPASNQTKKQKFFLNYFYYKTY
jgi:hypothetical protein